MARDRAPRWLFSRSFSSVVANSGQRLRAVTLSLEVPSRFCLLSVLDGDTANAKSALRAMNFDDETANALVGTHLSAPLKVLAPECGEAIAHCS
jgi:hypothetical protein